MRGGFTLLELLVVVAIIGILVAIALVNFFHAQVRAKVARARAEMAMLDAAMQAYYLDHGAFPRGNRFQLSTVTSADLPGDQGLVALSTPIAYMSRSLLDDPFPTLERANADLDFVNRQTDFNQERRWYKFAARWWNDEGGYDGTVQTLGAPDHDPYGGRSETQWYALQSTGPDRTRFLVGVGRIDPDQPQNFLFAIYDPTNGTLSNGSVWRAGGYPQGNTRVARFAFEAIQAASH